MFTFPYNFYACVCFLVRGFLYVFVCLVCVGRLKRAYFTVCVNICRRISCSLPGRRTVDIVGWQRLNCQSLGNHASPSSMNNVFTRYISDTRTNKPTEGQLLLPSFVLCEAASPNISLVVFECVFIGFYFDMNIFTDNKNTI